MKQQQFSPFLCVAAFALAVSACGSDGGTTGAMTIAGAGGGVAGTAATTAGTTGAAGTSVAGSAAAGRSGAAGTTPTATAGTGTVTAGTGAAGTAAAGTGAAGTAATAGSGGAAAGSGGAAAGTGATAGAGGAATGGTLGSPLAYTGPFTMGMTIPTANKCPMSAIGGGTGENKSPALAWKGGPAGTKSYAIVLFDTMYNMLHWVLWDIPVTVNMLPEGLAAGYALTAPAGAHQAASMGMNPHAYYGPCSSGALAGTYEYRLYALSADKLTLTEMSTGAQAQAAVEAAKLEMVVWSAKPM